MSMALVKSVGFRASGLGLNLGFRTYRLGLKA